MTLDELFDTLQASHSNEYIGEPISQLEHALQAAYFAHKAKADPECTIAALFHDIGHLIATPETPLMADLGVLHHEELGAQCLKVCGFSERTVALVAGHVAAKRYLVSNNENYAARLSEASRGTLEFQGGLMSAEEIELFEEQPWFEDILALRSWDEAAKEPTLEVPALRTYRHMARGLIGENT